MRKCFFFFFFFFFSKLGKAQRCHRLGSEKNGILVGKRVGFLKSDK